MKNALNDWSVAGIVAVVLVTGAVLFAYVRGQETGYTLGVARASEQYVAERKPAIQAAYEKGVELGTTEGVARVLGGYKNGRCRVTTDIPRAKTTTQPAPVTECVAVSWQGKSGLFIPDHGPTPTPVPTPEAQGR